MVYFTSSAVKRAEYDEGAQRLILWFPEGRSYIYCRVPLAIWQGLCNARSKGKYFNAHIDGRYHC